MDNLHCSRHCRHVVDVIGRCVTGATAGRSVQQTNSSDSDQLPAGFVLKNQHLVNCILIALAYMYVV